MRGALERAADAALSQIMTSAAKQILAGVRAYDVANHATAELMRVIQDARHGGSAYVLWASVSDLLDDPRGPASEAACELGARAVATDWLSLDAGSGNAVRSYFERWAPVSGSAWDTLPLQGMSERSDRR